MTPRTYHPTKSLLLALAAAAAAAGCENSRPGAGFTNPNPGSMIERDKASDRTDLAVPDTATGRTPADAAASSPAATGTNAGTAEEGGGRNGGTNSGPGRATPSTPAASPPTKENTGNAQGDTKPSGSINVGTPRSPQ